MIPSQRPSVFVVRCVRILICMIYWVLHNVKRTVQRLVAPRVEREHERLQVTDALCETVRSAVDIIV